MEDEYLKISVLHFILLGVYAFCSAVYAYFHFGAKIKNSGPILILSLVTLIKLSFLYPICVGIFETATSTQFFPFMGFLWLLGFYFYFKLVAKILGMSGRYFSIYTKILKICIILMGAITFAFKLSIVRKIFFTLKDPAKVDGFMYFPPDSMPTFYGYITIFILGTIIGLGHFLSLIHI